MTVVRIQGGNRVCFQALCRSRTYRFIRSPPTAPMRHTCAAYRHRWQADPSGGDGGHLAYWALTWSDPARSCKWCRRHRWRRSLRAARSCARAGISS